MSPLELDFDSCYRAVSSRDARFDGRFYTAVTTTRIYCRPICPARTPSARNVRFYRHAASAEAAGFRPCKRCRPELSPGDPGWDVRGDLVGRALRLIDDGAADEQGVAGLAQRLHITERHLHRLFVTELGVGPLAVARTKRLLLAKQLLTETALPVTEVAFAAGFGSVRQFNATMRETYGFTPSELRATAGPRARNPEATKGTGAGGATLRLRLHRREPYDVDGVFAFLASRAIPGLEVADLTSYARAVPGGTITLTPRRDHIALDVSVADTRQLARVVARCRRLLDLDADPEAIAQALGPTSLGPLVAARPGLRVPGAFDGFELAVRAVVGQQISVAGARTLLGRIVARAAAPDGLFPTPARLLDTDLTGLGLTGRRIDTLKDLAARVAHGHIDLDGGQDPAEAVAELLEVRGIGPWTASYIALRALRDPDAWPTGDLVLNKRMAALGIPHDHIERWRPWRAYAALHLWSSS
ncbi:Methylated-DNA--protein-cysteine methyltransferase [[Actinomadura] parvosata subsp. kistnae]|uniref:DNA-3-methyladenine glycosylase II n=1 Tax=[Actinomadura] parvosata subsp. kistnae TaxID=1909395 RepID=A0A1V0A921_9ACTN|nr:DNA-3-methyladenine glycosylase 2 family protein [Nonomuraea sp. ATCC 55076]AQZ66669.1 AraC family transcriptional regulator [Nonomuraea sp. ATCC 55076]SPL95224.1 Methylated-DNA--protein-cysteine methyltransferase [Actinomadura parvosata subsp. kistnae]